MTKHKHEWSKIGLWETNKKAIYPCVSLDCPAALLKRPGKKRGKVLNNRTSTFDIKVSGDNNIAKIVLIEIDEGYKLNKINFAPGDVIIDIGAHIGLVSISIAKQNPNVKIYAFEVVPENYQQLIENIVLNGVNNIIPVNCAVTGDGLPVTIYTDLDSNSGGSSAYIQQHKTGKKIISNSISLPDIFIKYNIKTCKLLKIDCEGSEYDIFKNTPADVMQRINHLRGEFHTNKLLKSQGNKPKKLKQAIKRFVKDVKVNNCEMSE